ncbi:MAG: hypothetical protein LBV23_08740 [Deltaproteobacteria bacterium]|jgi:nucleoside phosphorylase|nr:hypothetical protein [Deltaproteobacteria bacterium]
MVKVVVITPTPNEYRSVSDCLGRTSFSKLDCQAYESGPGRINAIFTATRELWPLRASNSGPVILVGCGTAGSLSLNLAAGEVIVSNRAVISDWRREDGQTVKVSPYGWFDYKSPDPEQVAKMVIESRDLMVKYLLTELTEKGFKSADTLTSEAFVEGRDHKLKLGRTFNCAVCDMESGALAYLAGRLLNVAWFNIRIVADTLDEALGDYFAKERNITEILGRKTVEILSLLDSLIEG